MADGSMIVSPISGLKNPADIGTKRLNDQRMRALMFLLGMFDSMNNCHVGEVEARAILQQQDLKQAMSSLRRLMKSDVDASGALQLMMFMNALSVARGMDDSATASNHVGWGWWFGYLLQIITLVACMIAGMVFLVRGLARQQQRAQIHVENVVEAPLAAVDGPTVLDEADDEFMQETSSDKWYRYKNCSMSECSDPEFWQSLNHIPLSSSDEEEVEQVPNPVRDRLLEVLEGDHVSNRAIASWLFARVNRRRESVMDEADDVIYTEMHYALSVSLINMTSGTALPSFDQIRGIVMAQSNLPYDENSPSATLSVAEMRSQIVASEVHAVEHYNGDGSLHHVSYTLVDDLMANSDPIDAVGPQPMEVEGPMFGPPTHEEDMLEDIHVRRDRALASLRERLDVAYNEGPEDLVWNLQSQIDWWTSII